MRDAVCRSVRSKYVQALLLAAAAGGLLSAQIPGRNVNMVSGDTWPDGDPYLQRQNEPSLAASTRNPLHLLAGANDYRTVDIPGKPNDSEIGDAWLGVFKSLDGGQRWTSTLLPGYPQDRSNTGKRSPLYGYAAAADPVVRPGTSGLIYFAGIVFDRVQNGKSRVFVARYIDNNNKEAGDPMPYLDTNVVASDSGTTGGFIDKPWMAVDVPRAGAKTCRVNAPGTKRPQELPAGNIYLAYTYIAGTGTDITATIMFSRSTDCGVSWSRPIAISRPTDRVNQGSTIAIDPNTGEVYVAWRKMGRYSTEPDGIVVTKSSGQGVGFTNPRALREFYSGRTLGQTIRALVGSRRGPTTAPEVEPAEPLNPAVQSFDQDTTPDPYLTFRTTAYPTLAIDGNGRAYLAWSERGFRTTSRPNSQLDSSVVMMTGLGGAWTAPFIVEMHDEPGHQIMPSLAFAGGTLMLVYYDLREDVSGVFGEFVLESDAIASARRRHTVDIRAAQADAVPANSTTGRPQFNPSVQVSQYVFGSRPGSRIVEQLQYNPPNLPLFKLGEAPFIGDYIDIAPAPAFVQDAAGTWRHNIGDSDAPIFHAAWTDNRDVRPPSDGNWKNYTPPAVGQTTSTFDPTQPAIACVPGRTGMRNQNVYTSRITAGLLAGSPGNSKPLSTSLQRGFVVFAQNTTSDPKVFRLTIENQPVGGRASFTQLESEGLVTHVDVYVPRLSTVSRTVFATSSDPRAKITVDVREVDSLENPVYVTGGLAADVVLNPDIANPDIANPDIANPDIANPDIANPDIANPDIANAEVYNPDIANPDIANPDIANPDIANPDIANPDIANVVVMNPDIANPDIANPDIANPDIANPDIANPDIANPDIANGSLTDVTWTVTNRGNTTASYDVNMPLNVPQGIKAQLIVHKTYKTPVSDGCTLKFQTQTVLVSNTVVDVGTPDIANASLWLEPGGAGKVTLRYLDPNPRDTITFNPLAGDTAVTPEVQAEAINTTELAQPDAEPPSATPPSVTTTSLQLLAQPTGGTVDVALGLFRVRVLRTVDGVTSPVTSAAVAAGILTNPTGAQLSGQSTVLTDASGYADFTTLALDRTGQGFTLAFTSSAVDALPITSAAFSIGAPAADPTQNAFVVTSTADSGPGTLRQAIIDANNTANSPLGPDVITFGFRTSEVHTINLLSMLPAIDQPVIIDGATQTGYNPAVGQPLIHVNGTGADSFQGLVFNGGAANSRVRALSLTGFGSAASLNTTVAIRIMAPNITIDGNWIGVSPAGLPIGNQTGIFVSGLANNTMIGGTSGAATRNVISAGRDGIIGIGGSGTTVRGNYIGTSPDGLTAMSNSVWGITFQLTSVSNTVIGGALTPGGYFAPDWPGNLISSNLQGGIAIIDVNAGNAGPTNTQILGNVIGLARDGSDLGNNGFGVWVRSASNTKIGAPGAGNVISGNGVHGLTLATSVFANGINIGVGASGPPAIAPAVQSNIIGLDPTGTQRRRNVYAGVLLSGPATVGGTSAGEGNLISGNGDETLSPQQGAGIYMLSGAWGSVVQGNTIGLTAAGLPMTNGYAGVRLDGTDYVTIGGASAAARNVISGNSTSGILLANPGLAIPENVTIHGNHIGVDAAGNLTGVGNGRYGIWVQAGTGVSIGGDQPGEGNVIAGNGGVPGSSAGVHIEGSAVQARIRANAIYDNVGLGINLGFNHGVLANDAQDVDSAVANAGQNYPLLEARTNAYNNTGYLRVRLDSQPGVYTIDVFTNAACDASSNGEGKVLLLTTTLSSAGAGYVEDLLILPTLTPGAVLTATATDQNGNTSEFSPCATAQLTNAFYNATTGHFYEYVTAYTPSWNAANAAANAAMLLGRSGHLVTISSAGENSFVQSLRTLMGLGDMRPWIGLHDPSGTGAWEWVTGETYTLNNYSNWGGGEPNNLGSERWVEFFASGVWNNNVESYGANQGYVIEYQFPISF